MIEELPPDVHDIASEPGSCSDPPAPAASHQRASASLQQGSGSTAEINVTSQPSSMMPSSDHDATSSRPAVTGTIAPQKCAASTSGVQAPRRSSRIGKLLRIVYSVAALEGFCSQEMSKWNNHAVARSCPACFPRSQCTTQFIASSVYMRCRVIGPVRPQAAGDNRCAGMPLRNATFSDKAWRVCMKHTAQLPHSNHFQYAEFGQVLCTPAVRAFMISAILKLVLSSVVGGNNPICH